MSLTDNPAAELATQWIKRAAFRWPILNNISRPRYSYNISPAQLSWLCDAITATKDGSDGCIVEVGCARGMTTAFLLSHMKDIGDRRPYICIDTFSGFTPEDVKFEVSARSKKTTDFYGFSYMDAGIFRNNVLKLGYPNCQVFAADAASFDWSIIPKIDVMLLDVDLFLPTKAVLERSKSRWSPDARVMVDDVRPGGVYDGAHDAYHEFCRAQGLPASVIAGRAGIFKN
jgi:hypothetical protein